MILTCCILLALIASLILFCWVPFAVWMGYPLFAAPYVVLCVLLTNFELKRKE